MSFVGCTAGKSKFPTTLSSRIALPWQHAMRFEHVQYMIILIYVYKMFVIGLLRF